MLGRSRKSLSLAGCFTVLVVAGIGAGPAGASTITVANTNDSGPGSLRMAIAEATPGDTVVLPASAGHYAITSAQLVIAKNLTITGAGARTTVIDAMHGKHRVLDITAGTVAISGVTITGAGEVPEDGGGITIEHGSLSLSNVSVSGNTTEEDDGGGIEARPGTNLTIDASTIADNAGYNGGGIYAGGTTTISDSTIAGNTGGDSTSNGEGGGIENNGSMTLLNDTIAGNKCFNGAGCGGAIDGSATAKNTIFADNLAGNVSNEEVVVDNCQSTVTSTGPNLENGSDCAFAAHGGISDANPLLTPLGDNGGPTDTMALLAGSPAIDHGTGEGCPTTDQRGGPRPQPPAGTCDIGAVEYGAIADVGVSQLASANPVTLGEPLTYTLTLGDGGPGPDAAFGTVLTDTLPAGASLVSATPSQGSCSGSAPVSCALGTLTPGAPVYVAIVVHPSAAGIVTNTATVASTATDPNSANNLSQLQTAVVVSAPATPSPPTLSNLSQTAKRWREGSLLAHLAASKTRKKRPPVGTTFSFTLNEAASVTFAFTRPAGGRKVGKRCVAQTKKNRHRRRCTRTVIAGTLTLSARAGANKLHFEGLISRHRKLGPGSYTLLATATAAGRHSTTRTLRFTIAG